MFYNVLTCRVASNNRVGGYARSEAEIEQIVDGLHEQEVSNAPYMIQQFASQQNGPQCRTMNQHSLL